MSNGVFRLPGHSMLHRRVLDRGTPLGVAIGSYIPQPPDSRESERSVQASLKKAHTAEVLGPLPSPLQLAHWSTMILRYRTSFRHPLTQALLRHRPKGLESDATTLLFLSFPLS